MAEVEGSKEEKPEIDEVLGLIDLGVSTEALMANKDLLRGVSFSGRDTSQPGQEKGSAQLKLNPAADANHF